MKNKVSIMEEFKRKTCGELIMTGKLYREKFSGIMSEVAFSQAISRLCKSGEIERVSKGIYCRPKKTRFGTILPSEREIIDRFTAGGKGMLVGYGLYNEIGVSTQVSKNQIVYSSITDEQLKQIGNVTIHKYDLKYTPEIKSVICIMELLHHYKDIQDINVTAMIDCIGRFVSEYNEEAFDTVQKVIGYPKWTIAFLREALNYYRTPNHLSRYLSSLTSYPIPRMEELFAISRNKQAWPLN